MLASIRRFSIIACMGMVVALAVPSLPCYAQCQQPKLTRKQVKLRAFLREFDKDDIGPGELARYSAAFVHLKNDRSWQVIVHLSTPGYCGSGGCTTLVLNATGDTFHLVSKIPITRLPILVLPSTSNGWHDISVVIGGGGLPQQESTLSYDGKSYPENPTVPPARLMDTEVTSGKVILPADAKQIPIFECDK
jgi:hypothetical protein